jgi:RNA polymerase sigma-70 factor (sigma-E family)
MDSKVEVDLHAFVAARYAQLRRTAYLLTGDWHRAEDLLQTALAKTVVAARRRKVESLDAYCRTVLLRAFLDESQRHRFRKERTASEVPEVASPEGDRAIALTLMAGLRSLPPGQRAAVVLRYWEDRSIEETAAALGVSTGTVKSQCTKGLAALRDALGPEVFFRA